MPFVDLGDIRLFYKEAGNQNSSETVVLLHGFTLDSRSWPRADEFLGSDYRLIIPDARGHGKSDCPKTGYSRDQRAEDLAQLVDTLKIDRFHLVGLSMGGSTAIGFALKYPSRLKSLTLVSSGAAGFNAGKKLAKIDQIARAKGFEAAREKWMDWSLGFYGEEQKHIAELMREIMNDHTGAMWTDPMRGNYPRTNDLDHVHEITTRTMIMAGMADRTFIRLANELAIEIPNSDMVVYENVGHMINLEIPERFYADLTPFLKDSQVK